MSFDPHSLERLRELGRSLPKLLENPDASPTTKQPKKHKLHRVETEENPQNLFRELMNVSSDGNIPPHLLNRLKEIEAKQIEQETITNSKKSNNRNTINSHSSSKLQSVKQPEEERLYDSFNRLLLEEEEEEL